MTKFEKQLMEYIAFEKQFDGNIALQFLTTKQLICKSYYFCREIKLMLESS